jgi:electron transport complex protein RnfB
MSPEDFDLTLADTLEQALPQTQCTKCGFDGCRPYAEAMARGIAPHNQCPPGGAAGVARLAKILGKTVIPLNADNGVEKPRTVAVIDESLCIGCTLCIQACPVDAIVGAAKQMHTVLPDWCTGCDLCVAPCPVDCIQMENVTGDATGWEAWTQDQADTARSRYHFRRQRLQREARENEARLAAKAAAKLAALNAENSVNDEEQAAQARKRAIIEAALARARARQAPPPRNTEDVSPAVQAQIDAAEARRVRLGLGTSRDNHDPQPPEEPNAS